MAVPLDGTNGLFTRIGRSCKIVEVVETHISDLDTRISAADGEYTTADRDQVFPLIVQRDALKQIAGRVMQGAWSSINKTIIDMVYDDASIPDLDIYTATRELIRQMNAGSETLKAPTLTGPSVTPDGANTGDGAMVAYAYDPQHIITETVRVECVKDAQVSGRAQDVFLQYQGAASKVPRTDPSWPNGSGYRLIFQPTDSSVDRGLGVGQNILQNSDFEDWTGGLTLDHFTTDVGSTSTVQQDSDSHRGNSSLRFVGIGSQLTRINQRLGVATGGQALEPGKVYVLGVWFKDGSVTPTAGVVRVSLRDATDTQVGGSAITFNASTSTTLWQFASCLIIAPDVIPVGTRVVIELTTALGNTERLLFDDLVLAKAYQLQGIEWGLYGLAVHGETLAVVGDGFEVSVTNNNDAKFIRHLQRAIDLSGLGLVFPTDSSPTISESLVT